MYKVVATDSHFVTNTGSIEIPLITLADEYGGRSQIAIDDSCFVLYNGTVGSGHYVPVTHWYHEAARALRVYPIMKTTYKFGFIESIQFLF